MTTQGMARNIDHKGYRVGKDTIEWVQAVLVALALGFLVKTFLFTLVKVEGPSMNPTLQNGDRLFVNRLAYKPQQGDVIVFKPAYDKAVPYIKRVIAVEGQVVDIDFEKGEVYIDGVLLEEPYLLEPIFNPGDVTFPATVPKGHVFVMGDNRNNSEDSRRSRVGMVNNKVIMGGAIYRWWPFNKMGAVK